MCCCRRSRADAADLPHDCALYKQSWLNQVNGPVAGGRPGSENSRLPSADTGEWRCARGARWEASFVPADAAYDMSQNVALHALPPAFAGPTLCRRVTVHA